MKLLREMILGKNPRQTRLAGLLLAIAALQLTGCVVGPNTTRRQCRLLLPIKR